jgi:uncharacterized protein (TIGR02145 family)
MQKRINYIGFLLMLLVASCDSKPPKTDGCPEEVTIGKQVWMRSNLNVDKFRNGDPIPEAKTEGEWKSLAQAGEPAWCNYDNEESNGRKYGKLYNWYAVNDPRGLAPKGWHVFSDSDWMELSDFLGGAEKAGAKMKSKTGWDNDGNGTNSSCFTGFPGGCRLSSGEFSAIGVDGYWWSSTGLNTDAAWFGYLDFVDGELNKVINTKGCGYSVRCLKD